MMPVRYIREKLVQEPDVVSLEHVGARLEHHGLKISVSNMFLSDCGDRWICKIRGFKDEKGDHVVESCEPSLRTAVIKALKMAEKRLADMEKREG